MQDLETKRPVVVAHRGGGGVRPENTRAAFDHAIGLGCEFLELDVNATRDGVPVCIHDPTVDRVTDGSGAVSVFTAAEITELDAGYGFTDDGVSFPFRGQGIRIPTLQEVFERYPRARMSIDIKGTSAALIRAVSDLVHEHGREERTTVGSFSCRTTRIYRRQSPSTLATACPAEVRRMLVTAALRVTGAAPRRPDYLMVPEYSGRVRVVTPGFLAAAARRGMQVFVWTVNDEETALRLAEAGVDGVITDVPGRIAAALGEGGPRAG